MLFYVVLCGIKLCPVVHCGVVLSSIGCVMQSCVMKCDVVLSSISWVVLCYVMWRGFALC